MGADVTSALTWFDADRGRQCFNVADVFRADITYDEAYDAWRSAGYRDDAHQDLVFRKVAPLAWLAMPCHDEAGTP